MYRWTVFIGLNAIIMLVIVPDSRRTLLISLLRDISKASRQSLQEYDERIQDTEYNIDVNLRQFNERQRAILNDRDTSDVSNSRNHEAEATKECVRICEDIKCFLESRARMAT